MAGGDIDLEMRFLGWKHPGPIEAGRPLAPSILRIGFLGWKHPGPIEAARALSPPLR
ncbi:hypothetical protein SBA3_330017 [Candidatus Sulfopaludibacter sp. SbA3]|nr:hypothetical protein SBA3_330017 [Candidatus Sulfopaludibacter sp. SbA3]